MSQKQENAFVPVERLSGRRRSLILRESQSSGCVQALNLNRVLFPHPHPHPTPTPPSYSSISRRVLFVWVVDWFSQEIHFYRSNQDSSHCLQSPSAVYQYFLKQRKQKNAVESTWSQSGGHKSIFGFLSNAAHHLVQPNRSQFPSRKNGRQSTRKKLTSYSGRGRGEQTHICEMKSLEVKTTGQILNH